MRSRYYIILISLSIFWLSSCSVTKNLEEDEYLLVRNKIKGNKEISKYKFEEFYRQKPNRKIVFLPVYLYFWNAYQNIATKEKKTERRLQKINKLENKLENLKPDSARIEKLQAKKEKKLKGITDSSKIDRIENKYDKKIQKAFTSAKERKKINKKLERKRRLLEEGDFIARFMRQAGERPVVMDTSRTKTTRDQMELFIHSKGYFEGKVKAIIKCSDKKNKARVIYKIEEGKVHKVKDIDYEIADQEINSIITKATKKRKINPGDNYDADKIDEERDRIYKILKNNGYFEFKRQFIFFEVDTTVGNHILDIKIVIKDPPDGRKHEQYKVEKVFFRIDNEDLSVRDTVTYKNVEDIYYIYGIKSQKIKKSGKAKTKFSKKILNLNIGVRPNEYYSQQKTFDTQTRLANIDAFKFININYQKTDSNQLRAFVIASPLDKFQFTAEGGVSVNFNQGQSLPGPFFNVSFKDRNLFRAFEILEISARYSIEAQASASNPDNFFRGRELGSNITLTFPQIIFPTRIKDKFNKWNPKTKLLVGFTETRRPEYQRANFTFSGSYNFQKRWNVLTTITPFEFNIINTSQITDNFNNYLNQLEDQGNNLKQSFRSSVVASLKGSHIINTHQLGVNKKSYYNRIFAEWGGSLLTVLKRPLELSDTLFGLPYYRFLKASNDFRYYQPTGKHNTLVLRGMVGLASPIGDVDVLPYEKFFFIGGSNSIRAWSPRRLGPGTFTPEKRPDGTFDYSFEQPGEILFEGNVEYRQKLVGFLHGAAFVDIGNVWTFEEDDSRPGASFRFDSFFKDVAVGSGFGLRFDFSFLIFRFDLGVKIRDPARTLGDRWVPLFSKGSTALNIGIGYPF